MLSLYTQTKCVTYRYSLIKITWVCTFTTKQKLKLKYPVSLWNSMEYSLVNIMSKKCGYILYMLSDYEASSKYTTHVITKSVNGCVYKWMRIPGGRWHVLLCLVVRRRWHEMSSSFCHNTISKGHMDSWYLGVILFALLSLDFDVPFIHHLHTP